nr:Transcriptional regulator, GntR family [Kibdelosporangium sp. MJ126-NF4]
MPDEVVDQLVGDVVTGELAAGESLPAERRLAEVLGVSRPAVREALQRMAHAGLLEVRQGGATTVRDFRRYAGLDLLPRLLFAGGELDTGVVRSILEARVAMGREVAGLAAQRGGAPLGRVLHEAVAALGAVADDPVAQQLRALEFWDLVVDGADSIVYRLMFNGLRVAYEPALEALSSVMAAEVSRVEAYSRLADAVAASDVDGARVVAADLLGSATAELLAVLRRLEE